MYSSQPLIPNLLFVMPKKQEKKEQLMNSEHKFPASQNSIQYYQQLRNDFSKMGKSRIARKNARSWTSEQDSKLTQLVQRFGFKWSMIGKHMKDKSGKSCRERWLNKLDPRISWRKMNIYEEWLLFIGQRTFGSQWAQIAKLFSDRTDNQLKNHWHTHAMIDKISQFQQHLAKIIMRRQLREIVQEVLFKQNRE